MLKIIIGILYAGVVSVLALYSLHLLTLIILYLIYKSDNTKCPYEMNHTQAPSVLVQVPIRNERHVVKNIIQNITNLSWPIDKLHIQIIDDSDDETYALAVSEVVKYQKFGYQIALIHRKQKEGYKAGALSVGMAYTNCEFIAIFDADFIPDTEFLTQTMPYFLNDPRLAMIQTRWTYENAADSFITHCEAIALDGHFIVDHIARNRGKLLMNFNGTAGVWRRSVIEQVGGWHSDTLAEDLDLSYRAQLAGWKCLYLPTVTSLSQLPINIDAFIQQQRRWAKGAAQTLRKLARPIVFSREINIWQKSMAFFHLSGYVTQLLFIFLVVLSIPMTLCFPLLPPYGSLLGPISAIPIVYYLLSQIHLYHNGIQRMFYYPLLALLAMSGSYNVTLALLDGFLHWGGEFIRTPKYSYTGKGKDRINDQREVEITRIPKASILFLYACFSVSIALSKNVMHYVVPSILFVLSQLLYYISRHVELRKSGRNKEHFPRSR